MTPQSHIQRRVAPILKICFEHSKGDSLSSTNRSPIERRLLEPKAKSAEFLNAFAQEARENKRE